MTARSATVEKVVTSGVFALDGGRWDVDNNVWLVGDDAEVLVIDAPHDAAAILDAVAGRRVTAIVLTHGHNDHINAAVELGRATNADVWFPPADRMLWDAEYGIPPDRELLRGASFEIAGSVLRAISTPGHSPGSTCLYAEDLGALFSGDTLFAGGPGATGRSYSDFAAIIDSIRDQLLVLPAATVVHTGHGDDTTIGAEAPHLEEWIERGTEARHSSLPVPDLHLFGPAPGPGWPRISQLLSGQAHAAPIARLDQSTGTGQAGACQ